MGRIEKQVDLKGQTSIYYYYDATNNVSGFKGMPGQLRYKDFYQTDPGNIPNVDAPDNAVPSDGNRYIFEYDTSGRKVSETVKTYDSGGGEIISDQWMYIYDAEGNIDTVSSPQGTVDYDYDSVTGRKMSTKIPDLNDELQVDYNYDSHGRLYEIITNVRNGDTTVDETTTYAYNAVGSRLSTTLPNGVFTWYDYNAQNRLTKLKHFNQTVSDPDVNVANRISSFEYDLYTDGMRASVTEYINSQNRKTYYKYDSLNRLIQEFTSDVVADNPVDTPPAGYGYKNDYLYDLAGNRQQRAVDVTNANGDNGVTTDYGYGTPNILDRLESETNTFDGVCAVIEWKDNQYAYAGLWNGKVGYILPGETKHVGQVMAFMLGLPSVWSQWLLWGVLVLIPVVAFAPVIFKLYRRLSKSASGDTGIHLSLFNRCVCVLLSYVMLLGPVVLDSLAQGQIQYSSLCTADWAKDDSISYTYDLNGAVDTKTSTTSGSTTESVTYEYNLQNRLSRVVTDSDPSSGTNNVDVVDYTYNTAGIRVAKYSFTVAQNYLGGVDEQTYASGQVYTDYLVDPYNNTGYAQVGGNDR
jgi:YD repeat-containing protein